MAKTFTLAGGASYRGYIMTIKINKNYVKADIRLVKVTLSTFCKECGIALFANNKNTPNSNEFIFATIGQLCYS